MFCLTNSAIAPPTHFLDSKMSRWIFSIDISLYLLVDNSFNLLIINISYLVFYRIPSLQFPLRVNLPRRIFSQSVTCLANYRTGD